MLTQRVKKLPLDWINTERVNTECDFPYALLYFVHTIESTRDSPYSVNSECIQ